MTISAWLKSIFASLKLDSENCFLVSRETATGSFLPFYFYFLENTPSYPKIAPFSFDKPKKLFDSFVSFSKYRYFCGFISYRGIKIPHYNFSGLCKILLMDNLLSIQDLVNLFSTVYRFAKFLKFSKSEILHFPSTNH